MHAQSTTWTPVGPALVYETWDKPPPVNNPRYPDYNNHIILFIYINKWIVRDAGTRDNSLPFRSNRNPQT